MTDREKIMNDFEHEVNKAHGEGWDFVDLSTDDAKKILVLLKEQETDQSKYEHHIDHTDCVWYKPEEGNECPVTCSQYRDGWNDAMNYIFRNVDGYRPYDRIRKER